MKEQDQIKAIAELDGWTHLNWRDESSVRFSYKNLYGVHPARAPADILDMAVPNYLYSYDAIIPVIQKQLGDDQHKWFRFRDALELGKPSIMLIQYYLTATPSQLTEALLRATGKWTT